MVKNKVGKVLISLMSLVLIVSSLTGCAKKNEEVVKPEESKVGLFNEIKTYEDAETYESGVISVDGVVLKNAEFTNDLVISDSVGEGTIYLDNVKIKGKLIIEGGGMNSIHIDNSDINKIVSNRTGGRVRIAVSENTKVQETEVLQDTKLEVSGNIANIKLSETAKGSEVLVNATAKVATLETKAEISLTVDSAIDKLSLQAPSNVVLNAPIENLSITKEAENTAISIAKDVVITNLATEGKVDVQGEGTITNATTTDKNNITGNVKPDSTVISETPISDQENPSIIVPTATPVATAKPKPTVQPTVAPTATPEPTVAPTPVPTPAPKPVTTVTISGRVEVGETLTAVSDGDVAKTTTWYVDGVEVGTNSSKYVIDIKDYGKTIKVKVNTVTSTETTAVGMPSNMVTISDAVISYQNVDEIILDFTTDKDIVLNSYSEAYTEEEIKKMYKDLLTGTNIEKQDAANKIGNDIVLAYYYLDGETKIPLKTKGKNELVKFKVWDGYLNQKTENGDYVKLPSLQEGIGYLGQTAPKGTWRTNTSPATGTVDIGWLDAARGHEVGVDIVIVYEGRISCKELKIEIPSKNVDPIISDANVKYDAISEDIIVEFELDKGFVLNNYDGMTSTDEITATYTSYLMGNDDANESAKKIGNDLILSYYYMIGNTKTPLTTVNNAPLVKFKMWNGYLNYFDGKSTVRFADGADTYLGQTIPSEKTWTTSTNPKTGTVDKGWLDAAKGHKLCVDIIVLYEGKTIKETVGVDIPRTNSVSFELNDLVSNEINTPIIQEDEESKLDVGITDTPAVLPTEEKEVDKEDEESTTEDSNAVLETTPQE